MTRIFSFLVLLIVCVAPARANDVVAFKTPKGIDVWLEEERSIPLISMDFSFAAGTLVDAPGKEGTTSLLAGLLDEGAGDLTGEAFRLLRDDNAIRLSFRAGSDRFYGSLQMPAANTQVAFDLLTKAINTPTLPADAMERMRQQALLGAQDRANDPSQIAFRAAANLAMPGHPYLRESEGTAESLAKITRDDVSAVRARLFSRNGLQVAIVGPMTRDEAAAAVDRAFGDLGDTKVAVDVQAPAPIAKAETKTLAWEMPQSFILFGGNGVLSSEPEYRAAQLLLQIVGGDDSRLANEIREKRGLTYGVSFSPYNFQHAAFTLGFMAVQNERAGEAVDVMRDVFRDVVAKGVTAEEVQDAKQYVTGVFAFNFESNSSTSGTLLNFMNLGLPPNFKDIRNAEVEAVTVDQVNAMAKRLLDVEKVIVVAIGKPVNLK
jgi:zinc protease